MSSGITPCSQAARTSTIASHCIDSCSKRAVHCKVSFSVITKNRHTSPLVRTPNPFASLEADVRGKKQQRSSHILLAIFEGSTLRHCLAKSVVERIFGFCLHNHADWCLQLGESVEKITSRAYQYMYNSQVHERSQKPYLSPHAQTRSPQHRAQWFHRHSLGLLWTLGTLRHCLELVAAPPEYIDRLGSAVNIKVRYVQHELGFNNWKRFTKILRNLVRFPLICPIIRLSVQLKLRHVAVSDSRKLDRFHVLKQDKISTRNNK